MIIRRYQVVIISRCVVTSYVGGFRMIIIQKCEALCGRYDYSDGLLIGSTNVHKVCLWSPVSNERERVFFNYCHV